MNASRAFFWFSGCGHSAIYAGGAPVARADNSLTNPERLTDAQAITSSAAP